MGRDQTFPLVRSSMTVFAPAKQPAEWKGSKVGCSKHIGAVVRHARKGVGRLCDSLRRTAVSKYFDGREQANTGCSPAPKQQSLTRLRRSSWQASERRTRTFTPPTADMER